MMAAALSILAGGGAAQAHDEGHGRQRAAGSCANLVLDLDTGRLSGVPATASIEQVMRAFPCATGQSTEGAIWNYGGGVFFNDHAFYFYTWRRFIEVRTGFKGSIGPVDVLGMTRQDIAARYVALGCDRGAARHSRPLWACGDKASDYSRGSEFYAMPWGCMAIRFREDRASEVRLFPELERDPAMADGCSSLLEPI